MLPGRGRCVLRKHKNESFGMTPLSEIWRHPIHTREFGSHLTNVLRCLQLESHGYQVTVTELVGWEHSLKNELIIATAPIRRAERARASASDAAGTQSARARRPLPRPNARLKTAYPEKR